MPSKNIFNLHVLMAGHGDSLWIEYGDPAQPARVLVDGGIQRTSRQLMEKLDEVRLPDQPSHELLVVTHVDDDHIAGVLPLVEAPQYAAQFAQIWFNGRKHLEPLDAMGAVKGDRLTDAIIGQDVPWNAAWEHKSVVLPAGAAPPCKILAGGANITLLSPDWSRLETMAATWDDEVRRAGLKKGIPPEDVMEAAGLEIMGAVLPNLPALLDEPYEPDDRPANGSSIAMLFEFAGASLLLGADAHPDVLVEAIKRLTNGKKLEVNVFKLPHHGSAKNVTPELLELVSAKIYVFSTNGKIYQHPDQAAVARVIHSAPTGATLVFNCRTQYNAMWDSLALKQKYQYQTVYGTGDDGVQIGLL